MRSSVSLSHYKRVMGQGTKVRRFLLWFLLIIILALSFKASQIDIRTFIDGMPHALSLIKEMFPPDFARWKRIITLTAETISVGFWGTLLGILVSVPLGIFSAKNTSPNAVIYNTSKELVNLLRAVPDIIYALIFVTAIGIGPVAGVIALMLATVGLLGKFYAEAVETIDPKPVEAIEAAGSHKLSVIRHAVVPQVFPLFMGYNLYALDHNIRAAMALGLVGAGGLGIELFTQMRSFNYQKVSAILIVMLIIIIAIDRVSAYLRKGIIEGTLFSANKFRDYVLMAIVAAMAFISIYFIPVDLKEIVYGLPRIWEFLSNMFPPERSDIPRYIWLMLETIAIGICGTFFAIVISIPLGMLAARNVTHSPVISNAAREIANFLRGIPDLVFALVFVAAVGLGPFAGVLALALHTAGFLGKFYAEAIENIDPKPVEAVEATGARFLQKIIHAVFPQALPLFNSYNLYILDRNIRASTVLGVVGAGGIGFELIMSMRIFEHQRTATLIIIILITITAVDRISAYLRKKVV